MTVSGSKGAAPPGLDQALQLIEIIKDPRQYERLLEPLKKSSEDAQRQWREIGMAGDIHRLHEQAGADRTAAAEELAQAGAAAQEKLAALDREYSTKMAALREREEDFDRRSTQQGDDLAALESALSAKEKTLAAQQQSLVAERSNLEAAQAQVQEDRAEADRRFAALKEHYNG